MNVSQIIAHLNAITVGDVDGISAKLDQARRACDELEQLELSEALREAGEALGRADFATYRKRVATVIARLGHLR